MIKKISIILGILLFIMIFPKNETMAGDLLNKGWYTITTKESPSYRLGVDDSKTGIKVQPANNKTGQKFLLTPLGDNLYTLGTGVTAGKYVIDNGQKTYSNQAGQKWQIIKNSDNTYSFKNKSDNKMMGYAGNLSTKPYCKHYDADSNNVKQKFIIKPVNNTYTVTFVNAEGKPIKRQAVESGKAATAPANPTKPGYTFNGWDKTFSNVTSNLTVNAKWTINAYKVNFNANGGSGSMTSMSKNYATTNTLTANTFTKTGYTFNGWNTKADGTGTSYADKASFKIPAANTTLYAQWKVNAYKVNFNANGGTGSMTAMTKNYGTTNALTANAFTKTGYIFNGWNTKADGTGESYSDEKSFKIPASNTTLYAQWKAKELKVIFHFDDPDDTKGDYSETYTYDKPNQEFGMNLGTKPGQFGTRDKKGYTLLGWNTDRYAISEIKKKPYDKITNEWINKEWANSTVGNNQTKTIDLYAIWKGYSNGPISVLRNYNDIVVDSGTGNLTSTNNGTWTSPWAQGSASPVYVKFKGKTFFYFRGESGNKDTASRGKRVQSLAYLYDPSTNNGSVTNWEKANSTPLFTLNKNNATKYGVPASDFESYGGISQIHVGDMNPFVYNGKVYLYFMLKVNSVDTKDSLGTPKKTVGYLAYATSDDGIHFTVHGRVENKNNNSDTLKVKVNNVEKTIPNVNKGYFVYSSNTGTYVKKEKVDGVEKEVIYLFWGNKVSKSTDGGKGWSSPKETITYDDAKWMDSGFNGTGIFNDGKYLYNIFAMNPRGVDWPEGFGLARCKLDADFTNKDNWEAYKYNPIMLKGPSGAPDSGAVWGLALYNHNGTYYVYYEGAGIKRDAYQGRYYNEIWIRTKPYYQYRFYDKNTGQPQNFSRILLGKLNTNDLAKAWSEIPITGAYKIKNKSTGEYLSVKTNSDILVTSTTPTTFTITYTGHFHQIKYNNKTIRPSMYDNNVTEDKNHIDKIINGVLKADGKREGGLASYFDKSKIAEDKRTDTEKTLQARWEIMKSAVYFRPDKEAPILIKNLPSGQIDNTDSKRGIEWQLYPEGNNTYTIQNRATGTFLNSPEKGKVNQAQINNQGTNDNTHWIITKA